MLVAADDVLDQIADRPFRARGRGPKLIRADIGKDTPERVLGTLVSS
ncbi:hypothetical protein MPS_0587 [Mycobacterium pseudoshottsii JCM 15466]|nr:hypothetical protein MPS_0587 [Mycobacterium pseudoshottsii JCM 15466]